MSNLSAFIKPAYTEKKKEFVVSDRFVDEEGKPVPVVMRSLKQAELDDIARRSTHDKKVDGRVVPQLDVNEHLNRCIIASMVFPDLTNSELCRAHGTEDPVMLPSRLFMVGEYEKISKVFAELNGLGEDDGKMRLPNEITKN